MGGALDGRRVRAHVGWRIDAHIHCAHAGRLAAVPTTIHDAPPLLILPPPLHAMVACFCWSLLLALEYCTVVLRNNSVDEIGSRPRGRASSPSPPREKRGFDDDRCSPGSFIPGQLEAESRKRKAQKIRRKPKPKPPSSILHSLCQKRMSRAESSAAEDAIRNIHEKEKLKPPYYQKKPSASISPTMPCHTRIYGGCDKG